MFNPFTPSREDGQTDADVLAKVIQKHEPGDLFPYGELGRLLEEGTNRKLDKQKVQSILAKTGAQVLKRTAREWVNVRGVGYKIAYAADHLGLSVHRKEKGFRQMKRSLLTLQHTNESELTEDERNKHDGHMLIMTGMLQKVQEHDRRLDRIERVLIDAREKGKL